MLPFQLITTNADLLAFCEQARQAPYLALDTEFVRTRTYYARLGLLQVRAGDHLVLIDPVSGVDLEPFWQLLKDPNVHVVIHAGGEDYEIFAKIWDRFRLIFSIRKLLQPLLDMEKPWVMRLW